MRPFYLAGGVAAAAAAGLAGWLMLAGQAPSPLAQPAAPPGPPPPAIAPAPLPAPPAAPVAATPPPPPDRSEADRSETDRSETDRSETDRPDPATGVRLDDPRHQACLVLAGSNPRAGLREAESLLRAGAEQAGEHCAAAANLALGQPAEAAARLERLGNATEAPSQLRAAWLAQAGQAWLMAGDATRAYSAATLALVLVPDDPDLLTDRAVAAATLNRPFDAIDDLNKVIDLDPARAEALVLRASAWRQAGRAELAADDIARALAIDPGNPEAFVERGMLRAASGDYASARGDFLRAAELAPGTPTEELARAQMAAIAGR